MYHGPAASAVDYFAGLGYPCPRYTNPAVRLERRGVVLHLALPPHNPA